MSSNVSPPLGPIRLMLVIVLSSSVSSSPVSSSSTPDEESLSQKGQHTTSLEQLTKVGQHVMRTRDKKI
jgi:hypothetical protein